MGLWPTHRDESALLRFIDSKWVTPRLSRECNRDCSPTIFVSVGAEQVGSSLAPKLRNDFDRSDDVSVQFLQISRRYPVTSNLGCILLTEHRVEKRTLARAASRVAGSFPISGPRRRGKA
jgi:hypothetical protein